jgi:hypothetical protein
MSNYAPQTTPIGEQPQKKSRVLVWVLAGCGGFALLAVIIVVVGSIFVWHKAKQAGFDPELMRKNPAQAVAKMIAATNPDIDIVSVDDAKGLITVKNKKTGETVTVNFEDARDGKVTFKEGNKDTVTIDASGSAESGGVEMKSGDASMKMGTGAPENLPSWLPQYPGVKVEGSYSMQGKDGDAGSFGFKTGDSIDRIVKFYEEGLRNAGLKVNTNLLNQNGQVSGGLVTGEDKQEGRTALVTASASGQQTQVSVTFTSKN